MNPMKFTVPCLAVMLLIGCASSAQAGKKSQAISKYQGAVYQGLLFDAMAQIDETVDHQKAMVTVRQAGVQKMALFARSRKHLGMNELEVIRLYQANPDLLVLGAPKFFQHYFNIGDSYINDTVKGIDRYNYAFVGEILFTHADKVGGEQTARGERYVDPDQPGARKFIKAVRRFDIPIMTHWEFYAWERDWPRFSRLYAEFPEQVFIIPHCGFGTAEQVETILARHPNVYMTLSKTNRRPASAFADQTKKALLGKDILKWPGLELRKKWRRLLIKYSARLMIATDPHMGRLWKDQA